MSDFHKFKSSIIAKSLLFFALVCIFFVVIKVKVNYEDVGRVVHDGGKIRCSKFTVLT